MIDGTKSRQRHPLALDAKRPGPVALLFGAAAMSGAIYAILTYDPDAFRLRSAEAFEHRIGGELPASRETDAEEED
jgi:hypothetical protein